MATKKQREQLREQLENEAVRLRQQLAELEDADDSGSWTGTLSQPGDLADAAGARTSQTDARTAAGVIGARLAQIEQTLERLEAGTYGACEVCGSTIDAGRLEAIPHTTVCRDDAGALSRPA